MELFWVLSNFFFLFLTFRGTHDSNTVHQSYFYLLPLRTNNSQKKKQNLSKNNQVGLSKKIKSVNYCYHKTMLWVLGSIREKSNKAIEIFIK